MNYPTHIYVVEATLPHEPSEHIKAFYDKSKADALKAEIDQTNNAFDFSSGEKWPEFYGRDIDIIEMEVGA